MHLLRYGDVVVVLFSVPTVSVLVLAIRCSVALCFVVIPFLTRLLSPTALLSLLLSVRPTVVVTVVTGGVRAYTCCLLFVCLFVSDLLVSLFALLRLPPRTSVASDWFPPRLCSLALCFTPHSFRVLRTDASSSSSSPSP